ncbi:Uncharacterised protein [Mycobacteroides abscessus subsp. abscessus]|uniref:hypothetical protein n=1 Tax=Mycobacteroides abscessus TaxID=36809 RepID=UPI0009271F71|nr:hypothetical protein [Mycobacteroides abscessus]SHQ52824.1 Uncharacterised protein [Mycobacteroides abscessus subsp. abscessus]SHR80718.1 Uncharacterised protein [Mycobacteroides abscessus subsp. abscessus]SLL31085.1 Uncharacterised protein [Mycobacteroides abscessus subsp. abscessus]
MTQIPVESTETALNGASQMAGGRNPLGVAAHVLRACGLALMVPSLVVFGVGGLLYMLAAPVPFVVVLLAYGVMMCGAVLLHQAKKLGDEAVRGELLTAGEPLSVSDPRRYLLAFDWVCTLTDHDGLLAKLESITESGRYLNQPPYQLPTVWASTDGMTFIKMDLLSEPCSGRTGMADSWTLVNSVSNEVVEQIHTGVPRCAEHLP